MARGRMIDKRISKSKKLAALKFDRSRILYFMILPHLDCEGKYSGDPEEIKEDCVPKLNFPLRKIAESIIDLANVGLLIVFEHQNNVFIQYIRFADFQVGMRKDREAPSRIPSPPKIRSYSGVLRIYSRFNINVKVNVKEGKKKEETTKKKEKISFNFEQKKFLNIKIEDKAGWLDAYPACDIDQELRKMREWLLANPEKKKINYERFITNWLSRTQDKGGSKSNYEDQRKKKLDDWTKKPLEK